MRRSGKITEFLPPLSSFRFSSCSLFYSGRIKVCSVDIGPEPITVICCFHAVLPKANCKLRQVRLCAGRMVFFWSRFAVKSKPVVLRLFALFGVEITSNQQGPSDDKSRSCLHNARLLALQSKLERMGCGWIVLSRRTEALSESSSSCMTADVAKLSVPQV